MKIVILGRGYRIAHLLDSYPTRAREVTVVTGDEKTLQDVIGKKASRISADPASIELEAHRLHLSAEDMLVVVEYDGAALRAILHNVRRQKPPCQVVVFSPLPARELGLEFPEFYFKSDRAVYSNEMRDLIRRTAVQQKVAAIRRIAREGQKLVVVIWGNPDPDAIASAFALKEMLLTEAPDFTISYMGEITRPENVAMARTIKIPMVRYAPELLAPGALVATVDAQPSFFQLSGPQRFDIIVDHHPLMELGPHRYADVRPTYGSTSTIFTEYFRAAGIPISRRLATALFYGLKVDTGNLTRNVNDADVDAFRFLRTRADENMIRTIELSQMPTSMLDHFGVALANKKLARDVVFSYLGQVDNPDACVHVADFFIKLSGISWAVVACRTADRVVIVFRSDGFRKHAGNLADRLFLDFGTAGGHRTMARAEIDVSRLAEEIPGLPDVGVERWLLRRLSQRLKPLTRVAQE